MKFERHEPPRKYKQYSKYRPYTREVFRQFCAYCFRHEDEAGGGSVFEQDHFEPKSRNRSLLSNYRNLYWSCRECNSSRNKDKHWPSREQMIAGDGFCDPIQSDPVGTDYVVNGNEVVGVSRKGLYTIRHIRLNRESLQTNRSDRARAKEMYEQLLVQSEHVCNALAKSVDQEDIRRRTIATEIRDEIRRFLQRDPFTYCRLPALGKLESVFFRRDNS